MKIDIDSIKHWGVIPNTKPINMILVYPDGTWDRIPVIGWRVTIKERSDGSGYEEIDPITTEQSGSDCDYGLEYVGGTDGEYTVKYEVPLVASYKTMEEMIHSLVEIKS